MNLSRLRLINARLQDAAKALAEEMAEPEAARDPLALYIYQARAAYRVTSEGDGKSGKRTERFLLTSYQKAVALGYRGRPGEWLTLMILGKLE